MSEKKRLGELLVGSGLISEETCSQALKMQVGGTRRLGRILVKMGAITSDQLLETLAAQFEQPIVDIEKEYSTTAQGALPRYLCRKYEVFPLGCEQGNILRIAMSDPSDNVAVADIEHYTGKAVQPCLARQSDIQNAINRHISISWRDVFNPQSYTRYAKIVSSIALVLVLIVAGFTYRFYIESKYGTVTRSADTTIYKNHDLMVGIERTGKATLLGRATHASGYYSISFDSPAALIRFIDTKKEDLSSNQYEWAKWAASQPF
jgi:Type II secretion system (T2SS), protein E, N-terminal domain